MKELEELRGKTIWEVAVDESKLTVIFTFTDGENLVVKAGGSEFTNLEVMGCGVDEVYSD